MKFLCDQCKAKYQIADEKVVGKTVRMKCRKCGHNIEVKAEVTETSVASAAVSDLAPAATTTNEVAAPPAAAVAAPPPPAAVKAPLATSLASIRTPPPGSVKVDAGALASAFQKSAAQPQKADAASLGNLQASSDWYVAINGVPVGPIRVGEIKAKVGAGGISEDSLCWREGMEEWRPVRAVTELAAVIREARAMERPSLTPPAPATPIDPRAESRSAPGPAAAPPVAKPLPARPAAPRPPARTEPVKPFAPAARSNVVALTSRLATAEKLEAEEDPTFIGDPFASATAPVRAPSPVTPVAAPLVAAHAAPVVAPAPLSIAPAPTPAPAAVAASIPASTEPVAAVAAAWEPKPPPPPSSLSQQTVLIHAQRKQPPWLMIGMLVLFGAFGITAAIVLLTRGPAPAPQTIIVTQPAAAPAPSAPIAAPSAVAVETVAPVDPGVAPAVASATPDKQALPSGAATKPAPAASAKPIDPKLAALLGGGAPAGPSMGGSAAGGGSGSGGSLSGDDIQRVVSARASGVKRTCWERSGGQQTDVSVKVHLTIAGNGSVSRASASGNDPTIAKCIENSVAKWTFPATGGSTEVDIPFHFLRQ